MTGGHRTLRALPRIGAPATRALQDAGVTTLADLTEWTEQELLALHGMGPRAIGILQEHLAVDGLSFRSDSRD